MPNAIIPSTTAQRPSSPSRERIISFLSRSSYGSISAIDELRCISTVSSERRMSRRSGAVFFISLEVADGQAAVLPVPRLGGKEQRGADRAAEVTQGGDADRGWAFVEEEVLVHLRCQRLHVALAEANAQPAADDHGFRVEQVDRGGDAGAERLDRPVDQLLGEVIAGVEGALPDAAGQPVFLVLVHQLEEVGLGALVVLAARLRFHRRAPGVGLHAALAPARALGAAALDDHVADLPSGTAAEPGLAVEDDAATDPSSPEDPDQALELTSGAEMELSFCSHLDVVADPHWRTERSRERLAEREAALPAGQVAGAADDAGLAVGITWRADADALQRLRLDPGGRGRLAQGLRHRPRHIGRSPAGRRRVARLAGDGSARIDDRRLDLRAAEIDSTAQISHVRQSTPLCRGDGASGGRSGDGMSATGGAAGAGAWPGTRLAAASSSASRSRARPSRHWTRVACGSAKARCSSRAVG